MMVHNCLHAKKAPRYLADYCTPVSDIACRRHLRSASHRHLVVPRHSLSTYDRRAFSVAGSAAWNSLCDELREPSLAVGSFTQLLKTRLFAEYYRAYSALEVSHIMRYANLLTYLLTYR